MLAASRVSMAHNDLLAYRVRVPLDESGESCCGVEEEKREAKRVHEEAMAAARAEGPKFFHPALQDQAKVDALTDPRVSAALNAKLNAPNSVAAEQFKQRNTTRVSAERKY